MTCVDANGNYLLANKRFTDFWGIENSEIAGKNYQDILADELKEKHRKIFNECLQGQTVEFVDKCRPVNAEKDCWSYGLYYPVFSNTGVVEKVLVAVMDITEQNEMKQQLIILFKSIEKHHKSGNLAVPCNYFRSYGKGVLSGTRL